MKQFTAIIYVTIEAEDRDAACRVADHIMTAVEFQSIEHDEIIEVGELEVREDA